IKDYIRQRAGLPAFKPNGGNGRRRTSDAEISAMLTAVASMPVESEPPTKSRRIATTYPYTDENGTLLYENVRFDPKDFRPRRADGKWTLDGCKRALYRLPELLQHPHATAVVTEGEKDADNAAKLGLCATPVICGDWKGVCVKALADRDVLILRDMDAAGAMKEHKAAQALHGTASTIRIVELPGLDGTKGKKDVS